MFKLLNLKLNNHPSLGDLQLNFVDEGEHEKGLHHGGLCGASQLLSYLRGRG